MRCLELKLFSIAMIIVTFFLLHTIAYSVSNKFPLSPDGTTTWVQDYGRGYDSEVVKRAKARIAENRKKKLEATLAMQREHDLETLRIFHQQLQQPIKGPAVGKGCNLEVASSSRVETSLATSSCPTLLCFLRSTSGRWKSKRDSL